jgi:hypothetical protein
VSCANDGIALPVDHLLVILGAPLNAQVEIHIGPDFGIYTAGITAALGSLRRLGASLLGTIATLATTTNEFAADGAAVSAQ